MLPTLLALAMEEGATSQGVQTTGKGKKTDYPLELPVETQPWDTLMLTL